MALNIAELIILSLIVDWLFRKCKIPGLVGMLLVGVIIGPNVIGLLKPELMSVSSDLRMVALIVILLRAGFELSKDTLRKVGVRAILLSFIPAVAEGVAVTFLGHYLLGLTYMAAAVLGAVLSAVSPAVVVPLMIRFIEKRKGTKKGIPTLILAASSVDDVFVIVIYSVLIGMYTGQNVNIAWKLSGIPISILSGIGVGLACGFGLYTIFEKFNPRATKRLLVILGISIFLVNLEHSIEHFLPFAALLAVMTIGFIILEKSQYMAHEMSLKLGKLWVFAEIVLFTLVGAQVNLSVALKAGLAGSLLIFLALIARSAATYLCLLRSKFSVSEKLFIVISYIPKATVQAAIGGAPLLAMKLAGMDTQPGEIILAVAVLSIILTAPLGAWAITFIGNRVLKTAPLISVGRQDKSDLIEDELLDSVKVGDLIKADVLVVREDAKLTHVFDYFASCDYVICPVVNRSNSLLGIIKLEYIRTVLNEQSVWNVLLAHDVMKSLSQELWDSSLLRDGLRIAKQYGLEQIPVMEKGARKVVGILDVRDGEKFVEQKMVELKNKPFKAI